MQVAVVTHPSPNGLGTIRANTSCQAVSGDSGEIGDESLSLAAEGTAPPSPLPSSKVASGMEEDCVWDPARISVVGVAMVGQDEHLNQRLQLND